jgi:hypothetical protein
MIAVGGADRIRLARLRRACTSTRGWIRRYGGEPGAAPAALPAASFRGWSGSCRRSRHWIGAAASTLIVTGGNR